MSKTISMNDLFRDIKGTIYYRVDDLAREVSKPTGKGKKKKPGWIKLILPEELQPENKDCMYFQETYLAYLAIIPRAELKEYVDKRNDQEGAI